MGGGMRERMKKRGGRRERRRVESMRVRRKMGKRMKVRMSGMGEEVMGRRRVVVRLGNNSTQCPVLSNILKIFLNL